MKKIVLTMACLLATGAAQAELVALPSSVVQETLLDATKFGQCMVKIDRDVRGPTNGACRGTKSGSHLTFACDGSIQNKAMAEKMFEATQVAQFASRRVRFEVDTAQTIDGYCLVTRMDIE